MTILPRASAILLATGLCLTAESFSPSDVKIIGDLDYGATSDPVEYTPTPRYRAFVFNGNGGDQIEVTAKGEDRTAFVAIADGGLNQLASGTTQLKFTLPKHGPDLETFYIVFRDTEDKPARFTVTLKKSEQASGVGLGPIRRPARTALATQVWDHTSAGRLGSMRGEHLADVDPASLGVRSAVRMFLVCEAHSL